jgi:hypothetical protein
VKDDFVAVPLPRLADLSPTLMFAAVEGYKREAATVDARLFRKVTLAFKATSLSDLCHRLREETGIHLTAGASVADEKVTLFCKAVPLRDVMRQLSRPFGYAWTRSGKAREYRYELLQDLRSQLLEEELRNRDRHAALIALDGEMERYRKYRSLSPNEALAQANTASPAERPLLEKLSGAGWGPIQLYFRLSPQEQSLLRSRQELFFATRPEPGEQELPAEVARGVLQSFRDLRVHKGDEITEFSSLNLAHPDDPVLEAVPEVRAGVRLTLTESEAGQLTLGGVSRVFFTRGAGQARSQAPYATGRSPAVLAPDNRGANARWAHDPALASPVTVQPESSCRPVSAAEGSNGSNPEPKVTSADVLEAFHRATGLPVVADAYTRLFKPTAVTARQQRSFDALNQLCDRMGLKWNRDGEWLQFRSTSYYDDRLKEVPGRLLTRWSAARLQKGSLSLDDLVEIAALPDAQLDGADMAEGARECWGLAEWDLARSRSLRPHLRYLATFTPQQRQMALAPTGLPFISMTLAQQQQFIASATLYQPLALADLAEATLRVDYTQPGWFQWGNPGLIWSWRRWAVVVEPGPNGRWAPRPVVRERTREAAMQAVMRIDPKIRGAAIHELRSLRDTSDPPPVPLEAQIFPTELSLAFAYFLGPSNAQAFHIVYPQSDTWQLVR